MVKLADQKALPLLSLSPRCESFVTFRDDPAQLKLRHHLGCERRQRGLLVLVQFTGLMIQDTQGAQR